MKKSLSVLALTVGLSCIPQEGFTKSSRAVEVEKGRVVLDFEGEKTTLPLLPYCNGLAMRIEYQRAIIEELIGKICIKNKCVDKNTSEVSAKRIRRVFPKMSTSEIIHSIKNYIALVSKEDEEWKFDICSGAEEQSLLIKEKTL